MSGNQDDRNKMVYQRYGAAGSHLVNQDYSDSPNNPITGMADLIQNHHHHGRAQYEEEKQTPYSRETSNVHVSSVDRHTDDTPMHTTNPSGA